MSIDWKVLRRRRALGRPPRAVMLALIALLCLNGAIIADLFLPRFVDIEITLRRMMSPGDYQTMQVLAIGAMILASVLWTKAGGRSWHHLCANGIYQCTACGHALDPDAVKQPGAVCPECGASTELEDLRRFWHPGVPRKPAPSSPAAPERSPPET